MIGIKRTYSTSKNNVNRYSSKGKDASKHHHSSRHRSLEMLPGDGESNTVIFPIIKQSETAKSLPRYTAISSRLPEDGVTMDDLDPLQQDFEKLLSNCAVRTRLLLSEVDSIDRVEDRREKKGKFIEKQPFKRKRPDDRSKYRDARNGRVFRPRHHNILLNSYINDLHHKHEVPKVTLPRNDTSDKFWSSIEPYCVDLSRDEVNFLDDLIHECSLNINVKIPEAGEHYAMEWAECTLNQEQALSTVGKHAKTKTAFPNDLKKNGCSAIIDTFSSPLTQRLLAALLEEKVIKTFPSAFDKLKASDFAVKNGNGNGNRGGVCLDRRLRKELLEQGILDVDDLPKTYPPDDDILLEIKKCQQELIVVNEHNICELNKLRMIVAKDLRRQEVKNALCKVDNKIMAMYNTILISKQKYINGDEKGYDKHNNRVVSREYDEETNKLIKQQSVLHRELAELTDFSLLQ